MNRREFLARGRRLRLTCLRACWLAPPSRAGKAEHCIFLWLGGGMGQIDTFDPNAAATRQEGGRLATTIRSRPPSRRARLRAPARASPPLMDRVTAVRTVQSQRHRRARRRHQPHAHRPAGQRHRRSIRRSARSSRTSAGAARGQCPGVRADRLPQREPRPRLPRRAARLRLPDRHQQPAPPDCHAPRRDHGGPSEPPRGDPAPSCAAANKQQR